jgi:hypothetical protein
VPPGGWTEGAIKEAFLKRFGVDSKTAENHAVDAMVRGRLTQGNNSVQEYIGKFLNTSKFVPDMPGNVLCAQFYHGLNPELQPRCCLDNMGNAWTHLPSLMHHAQAEATRLNLIAQLAPAHARAPHATIPIRSPFPSSKSSRPASQDAEPSTKRSRPTIAAVVPPPVPVARHPNRAFFEQRRPFGYTADNKPVYWNPPVNYQSLFPMTSCPHFGSREALTDEMKVSLRAYWICIHCRTGQHPAELCPANPNRK